jgi:hypothetical protein
MIVTLESTTKTVTLIVDGHAVPARIWEGRTAKGIRCHAYVTRIAVHQDDNAAEFQQDLAEQRRPSVEVEAIPLRLVI